MESFSVRIKHCPFQTFSHIPRNDDEIDDHDGDGANDDNHDDEIDHDANDDHDDDAIDHDE